MEKSQKKQISFIIFIGILILLTAGILIGTMTSKDASCTNNPLAYGVEKLEEINEAQLSCSCFFPGNEYNSFGFDDEGVYDQDKEITILTLVGQN